MISSIEMKLLKADMVTEQELIRQYIAVGVCPWHPIHELPCPVCYLRSYDSYTEKVSRNPKPGKGLHNDD